MTALIVPRGTPLRDRLRARLIIDPSGCLLWTGRVASDGYGRITVKGAPWLVHRIAWELEYGPIPDGLVLDHVRAWGCYHRHCANIAHLEPVTVRENLMRADTFQARNAAKTHCDSGHEFTPENTYIYTYKGSRWRQCRTCPRVRYMARKLAKAATK
jgi:HNH endonuclease